jgi:hypothetical protein
MGLFDRLLSLVGGNGNGSAVATAAPPAAPSVPATPRAMLKSRVSALAAGREHKTTPRGTLLQQLKEHGWEIKPQAARDQADKGSPVVPHILTFTGYSSLGRVYRNPDEAIRHSQTNAIYMRNDLATMECIEARQRLVALGPWRLETDNMRAAKDKELCETLTKIVKEIPRFTEYRRNLQEAIWYGRHAIQGTFGDVKIAGRKCCTLTAGCYGPAWAPINGDKLAFRYGSNQVGIRIGWSLPDSQQAFFDEDGKERRVEITSGYGRCYFLDAQDRERVTLHKHMIEDGDYLDSVSAGSLHGVGIRSRIYWTWFQKQSVLQLLMEYLERSAVGFEVWTYPWGNAKALEETQNAAINRTGFGKNVVFVPRMPNDPDLYSFTHQETGLQGIEMIDNIIHRYFEWQIKRYILGQITSSEPEGAGLGSSGLTDFQADTLSNIIKYDAQNSDETMSTDLIATLQRKNRHVLPVGTEETRVRFKTDTEDEELKEKMDSVEKAVKLGLRVKVDDCYDFLGLEKPLDQDETIGGQPETAGVAPGAQSIMGTAQPGESVLDLLKRHIGGDEGQAGGQPGGSPPEAPPAPPADPAASLAEQFAKQDAKLERVLGELERYRGGRGDAYSRGYDAIEWTPPARDDRRPVPEPASLGKTRHANELAAAEVAKYSRRAITRKERREAVKHILEIVGVEIGVRPRDAIAYVDAVVWDGFKMLEGSHHGN